ncbi:LRR domain containing protein [Parasponia andersonii]|uniref:LRR domain containing protein n=1 Tax=Parasponia andersonii TaxID=3476 RepID=A0A2P5DMA0_PARAD|nr:LRR domain containing protein [Parasponia andersonii]
MHRLLPSLAYLKIDGCPEIESFPQGGLPSKLEVLRIWNCSKLLAQHAHWDFEGLNSLKTLGIGDSDVVLDSLPAGSLPAASLTFVWLRNLPGLQSLNGSAFKNVTSLHLLRLSNCKELQYLPEQMLRPTFLSSLWIAECPILERRYRKEKGEDWNKISHIPQILFGRQRSNFPRWVGDYSKFSNIVSMTLIGNKHCCSLPPLGQLPSLEILIIKSFPEVETIGDEFYGNISSGAVPFPSLEELKIEDLEIDGCPEIESFPEGGLPSKLEVLRIRNCSKLLAQHGHWDFEGLTSLKSLGIGRSDVVLDSFPAGSLPAASLTFLWLSLAICGSKGVLFLNNVTEKRKGRIGIRSPTFPKYYWEDNAKFMTVKTCSAYCLE